MKKTRILALALALVTMISLIPVTAMAEEAKTGSVMILPELFESAKDHFDDFVGVIDSKIETIEVGAKDKKVSPDKYVIIDGEGYDLVGIHTIPALPDEDATEEEWAKWQKEVDKWWEETAVGNGKTSIKIPAFPVNGTEEEKNRWYYQYEAILAAYAPHQHKFKTWETSATNHWGYCYICKENFVNMDWHHDWDGDDVCDTCKAEIVYYDITVAEATGGKVAEMEGDKDGTAAYRDEIVIEVEADSGYTVKDVRFYKVREDGSKAEIVRKVITAGKTYSFEMPSFDVEIVVTYAEG